jgi:EAL domain-containing protein (putative c-di-GMP-specific phosphodiesterase class I)
VLAIIAMAKALSLDVVAEGVETASEERFLFENGGLNIQGYSYSRPLAADDMTRLLQQQKS